MRRWRLYLLFVLLILVTAVPVVQAVDFNTAMKQSMPQADRFTRVEDIDKYRTTDQPLKTVKSVFNAYSGDKQIGVVVYVAPKGYKDEIHSLVAMDMQGTIKKTVVILHYETASYVAPLKKGTFQKSFEGISLLDKLTLVFRRATRKGEVEAITNASITSEALALGVSEARRMFAAMQKQ